VSTSNLATNLFHSETEDSQKNWLQQIWNENEQNIKTGTAMKNIVGEESFGPEKKMKQIKPNLYNPTSLPETTKQITM